MHASKEEEEEEEEKKKEEVTWSSHLDWTGLQLIT